MNRAKVQPDDYLQYLIAAPRQATATEMARCHPERDRPVAHDAFTRLLERIEPDAETLWQEVLPFVLLQEGFLVFDDSVLDKPYASKMGLVHRLWSGKHRRVVKGIGLLTALWTDGDSHLPLDYRLYDKPNDGLTKNDHFRAMLAVAKARGFAPKRVLFDNWYASLENLKYLRELGYSWLTQLKANRRVNPDGKGLRPLSTVAMDPAGTVVHLEGYGWVKVFLIVTTDGDKEYWATDDLEMDELTRLAEAETSWKIEEYHRGIKQVTLIERCQARLAKAQRNHIGFAIRAFVRVERWCFHTGINWFEAKWDIVRHAVRAYLTHPHITLPKPSTA